MRSLQRGCGRRRRPTSRARLLARIARRAVCCRQSFTVADCALASYVFFFADLVASALGHGDVIAKHPKVAEYQSRIERDAAVKKVLNEVRTALASSRLKALVEREA